MGQVQQTPRPTTTTPTRTGGGTPAPRTGGQAPASGGRASGYSDGRRALQPQPPAQQRGFWGQLGDRASQAGSWVADKASDAAAWTRETANSVTDWAGNAVSTAGTLWDTARHTDVDIGRDGVSASLRMRDLQRALPPEAMQAFGMDERSLDDRVQANYQYGSHSVTLTAPHIALTSLNISGFRSGAASANNVTVILSNPGGKIPFLQDGWQTSGDLRVAVSIASAVGENVSYGTTEPLASASRVELHGITVTGAAPTARVTGLGQGNMQGSFAVQRAVVAGLSTAGASADNLVVSGGQANWREDTQGVQASARDVSATNLAAGGNRIARGSASALQANFDRNGGTASAGAVGASGVQTSAGTIGSVRGSGLTAGWNTQQGTATADAARLSAGNVALGDTRIAAVNGAGVGLRTSRGTNGQTAMSGSAQSLGMQGLSVGDALQIRDGSAAGVTASTDARHGGFNLGAQRVTANGIGSQGLNAASITGSTMAMNRNGQTGNMSLTSRSLVGRDLEASGVTAAGVNAGGFQYQRNSAADSNRFSTDSVAIDRLASPYGQATTVNARGVAVESRSAIGELDVDARTVQANSVTSAQGGARVVDAEGLRVRTGPNGYDAGLASLGAQGIAAGGFRADGAQTTGLAARGQGQNHSGSIATTRAQGLSMDGVGTARALELDGLRGSTTGVGDARVLEGSLGRAQVDGLSAAGVTADRLSAQTLAGRQAGGTLDASLGTAQASALRYGDASVTQASLDGARVSTSGAGTARAVDASLGAAQATGLRYGDVASADSAALRSGTFSQNAQGLRVGAGQANVAGASYAQGGNQVTAGAASVNGLDWSRGAQGSSLGIESARADRVAGGWTRQGPATGGGLPQIPHVDLGGHQLDATANFNPGTIRLGAGSGAMARDAAGLVDDARINASVPLMPADLGMVEIEQNTQANARIGIQDGQLVPGQTNLRFSRPLDAPLWTSVRGIDLEGAGRRHPGRGEVRANVGGFFDPEISSEVMGAMGQKANTVPLGVSELAGLATRNQPDAASDGQQVTLARERQGDNELRIRSDAQGAVGNFVRLLVGSLQMRMGTTSVETGRTAATGGTVETRGAANQPEQLNGTIDSLEIQRLRTQTPAGQ
ncbi:MAG: hypothetical protein IV100_04530 [Myxococcales bacterium]|nr:hypothetical protein [Myxococcales bacterium]